MKLTDDYKKQFSNGIRSWREALLNVTIHTVCNDRNNTYGEPEDVFLEIAEYWSAYLDKTIDAYDVALMMVLFKVARGKVAPGHMDNLADIAGYAACAADSAAAMGHVPTAEEMKIEAMEIEKCEQLRNTAPTS